MGIGTTNPSNAAMLEVSSTSDFGTTYKGFMPPRVPDVNARDAINPTLNDIGLVVYVQSIDCLQMWNGVGWEDIYCITIPAVGIASQDFDASIGWTYAENPTFYNVSDDIWDIVGSLPNIDDFTGNFLGCRDLDNPNGGGPFPHVIEFDNVNVSAGVNVKVAFDYDVHEFDNGDLVEYEIFHDDVGQGVVILVDVAGDTSVNGTEIINIPSLVTQVRLTLSITQDGGGDYAGFDNFMVYGQ